MGNNSSGMEGFQNRIIFEHNRCKPIYLLSSLLKLVILYIKLDIL